MDRALELTGMGLLPAGSICNRNYYLPRCRIADGLDELVRARRGKNLTFSTDIAGGIAWADIIFVSVNTPTKTFGDGAGEAADLQYWEKTAREIMQHAGASKIVVEKSTLPVRTADAIDDELVERQVVETGSAAPGVQGSVHARAAPTARELALGDQIARIAFQSVGQQQQRLDRIRHRHERHPGIFADKAGIRYALGGMMDHLWAIIAGAAGGHRRRADETGETDTPKIHTAFFWPGGKLAIMMRVVAA